MASLQKKSARGLCYPSASFVGAAGSHLVHLSLPAQLEDLEKAELELGPLPPVGPEVVAEKVGLDGAEAPRHVSVEKAELPAVELTEELERRTTGRGHHLVHTPSARF